MVNEISISNYKSILHQQFTLSQVNVFIGKNGCGKTNILEAIGLASAAHDDDLDTDGLWRRGIRAARPELTFHSSQVHELQKEIEIAWRERHSWKKAKLICDHPEDIYASWKDVSWKDPEYINKLNDLIKFIGDGSINEQYPFPDESKNAVLNAAFRGSRIFRDYLIYNINTAALRGATNESRKEPLGIFGEGLDLLLSTFDEDQLHEIKLYNLIPWLRDIAILDHPKMEGSKNTSELYLSDKYMQIGYNFLSLENVNSGTLHILFYLALFISKRTPSFFAIDNIEAMLDSDLCRDLMKTIVQLAIKQNKQVLITTHHPAIIDGLDLSDDEQKLFVVRRAEDGQTIVEEQTSKPQSI